MSDILIKGMELPKSCYTCQFCDNYEGSFCLATNDAHHIDYMTAIRRRPKWCPIVEVRPHGDLCDKKVLYDKMVENIKIANAEDFGSEKAKEHVTMAFKAVLYELGSEIPTVLEASDVF